MSKERTEARSDAGAEGGSRLDFGRRREVRPGATRQGDGFHCKSVYTVERFYCCSLSATSARICVVSLPSFARFLAVACQTGP